MLSRIAANIGSLSIVDAQKFRRMDSRTVGTRDLLTSTRFADRLKRGIRNSELLVFDGCAHAALYERVEDFNQQTPAFLRRHAGAAVA